MKHIVDTHALLWHVQNDKRLGPNAARVLSNPASELVLPATAYGEACWIVEHGRTNIPNVAVLQAALDADPRFVIMPLDKIAATALVLADRGETLALLTHDADITASALLPIVW